MKCSIIFHFKKSVKEAKWDTEWNLTYQDWHLWTRNHGIADCLQTPVTQTMRKSWKSISKDSWSFNILIKQYYNHWNLWTNGPWHFGLSTKPVTQATQTSGENITKGSGRLKLLDRVLYSLVPLNKWTITFWIFCKTSNVSWAKIWRGYFQR